MERYVCPQCGYKTEELHEGYCEDCLEQRNSELQEFIHREVWWNSLTDTERDSVINSAANPCYW